MRPGIRRHNQTEDEKRFPKKDLENGKEQGIYEEVSSRYARCRKKIELMI